MWFLVSELLRGTIVKSQIITRKYICPHLKWIVLFGIYNNLTNNNMNRMEFRGKIKQTLCHETEIVWFQFNLFANVSHGYWKYKKLVSYRTNTILSHTSRLPGFISFFSIRLSIYLRTVRETQDSFFFRFVSETTTQKHKHKNAWAARVKEWREEKKNCRETRHVLAVRMVYLSPRQHMNREAKQSMSDPFNCIHGFIYSLAHTGTTCSVCLAVKETKRKTDHLQFSTNGNECIHEPYEPMWIVNAEKKSSHDLQNRQRKHGHIMLNTPNAFHNT